MWVTKTCRTSSGSTPLSFKPRIKLSTQVVGPVSITAADPSPIRRKEAMIASVPMKPRSIVSIFIYPSRVSSSGIWLSLKPSRRRAGGSRRPRVRLLCVFEREVRVPYNVEHVAVRVEDGRHPDVVADVLNAAVLGRAEFEEPTDRRVRIVNAPVSDHAGAGARDIGPVRLRPEPECANATTHADRPD